jgi:hypothetical protein
MTLDFSAIKNSSDNGQPPSTASDHDPPPNPFDPERCRLSTEGEIELGVRELLVSVPFRRPSKETWFRVHPGDSYRQYGGLIELKEGEDSGDGAAWVDPGLWGYLVDEPTFSRRLVVTYINRSGVVALWGLRLPGPDGRQPEWLTIPMTAAKTAETKWTRMFWDQSQRRHRVRVSETLVDEPKWDDLPPFYKLLELAFKDRVVTTLEDPLVRKLQKGV